MINKLTTELMDEAKKVEIENGVFDVSGIYTPLSIAKKEIWNRWNDKELRNRVEDYFAEVPEVFKDNPKAVLFRNVATPNFEAKLFLDLASCVDLKPAYIEFTKDKFCTRNQDKLTLGKMVFFCGKDKKGGNIINHENIIDIKNDDNKHFDEIETHWGENFIDFHHRMFAAFINSEIETFDISQFKANGESAFDVYVKVLSFFVCHGVLFENYIEKDNHYEKRFTNEVVLPAIAKVESIFGLKPLIIPLLPIREEANQEWMWYPSDLRKEVTKYDQKIKSYE